MNSVKIKEEFKNGHVSFNGGGNIPLGQRTDLEQLAIIAHESKDPSLLNLFEQPLPSLEELKRSRVDAELKKVPALKTEQVDPAKDIKQDKQATDQPK